MINFIPYDGDKIGVIATGQGPAVIVPYSEVGPTNSELNVPPTLIVYTTSHLNPLIVTVAISLFTGDVPTYINYVCTYM